MNTPNRGAVAALADVAAQVIAAHHVNGTDSTGQYMASLRLAMLAKLQRALMDVYPDARDHNTNVRNALARKLGN